MDLRVNVNTRLQRLDEGDFDGIILAAAGLKRLGMEKRIQQIIPADLMLPAVGQGALGVECREEDERTNRLLGKLDHSLTRVRVTAERAVNERLDGGCHLPVAAYAEVVGDRLRVRGLVGRPDGSTVLTGEVQGTLYQGEMLGHRLAENLLRQGASRILENVVGS
jgi:hydroxymethylbilane synthase